MYFTPVVGLEIHLQVKTKSKMFSRVSADYFQDDPNTHVDQVDFGLPGALPMVNKLAFEKAIKFAMALNCEINQVTKFDRKNYFYPDLPKGYQISQYDKPIGYNGFVEIEIGDDSRRIRITRVHLEEDTGKSIHTESGETLIDYNKSGIPLIEIVTEPDFESVEEVIAFAKRLRQIARYTETSDAEMQKGQMRFELNISVKKSDETKLPNYQVEVKNIGSISVLEKVIEFETRRQIELLENGEQIKKQTRGLKDMTGETLFQRLKETADDYRYFPEPDIPPITITDEQIKRLKSEIPELPGERKKRFMQELGIDLQQSENLIENFDVGTFIDESKDKAKDKNLFVNLTTTVVTGGLAKYNISFDKSPISSEDVADISNMISDNVITGSAAKTAMEKSFKTKISVKKIIEEQGLTDKVDESDFDKFIMQAIEANPDAISDLEKNPNAIKFLVGQVMRLSKGRVNPNLAEEKLKDQLGIKSS